MRYINPSTLPQAPEGGSHGVLMGEIVKRLIIGGQTGFRADGSIPPDFEGQIGQAFENFIAVIEAAQLDVRDVVRLSVRVVAPGSPALVESLRSRKFGRMHCALSYCEVVALSDPRCLIEVDGEAARSA